MQRCLFQRPSDQLHDRDKANQSRLVRVHISGGYCFADLAMVSALSSVLCDPTPMRTHENILQCGGGGGCGGRHAPAAARPPPTAVQWGGRFPRPPRRPPLGAGVPAQPALSCAALLLIRPRIAFVADEALTLRMPLLALIERS
jgi:hypothetical protein